ncbi:MAG: solute carrier family 23 protein [Clostridiales bacterium]|nr:solute carrier family 23 protein [Clostridiales bacterium]
MKLTYQVSDRPSFGKLVTFAIQQLLAIMTATLVVPVVVNNICGTSLSPAAALFGAGVGTLVYLLFTKFRSPVFLGSSFAFINSMCASFAGAASMSVGYIGLIIGAAMAGLVYVVIALIVKLVGVKWISKIMPATVIGPTVAIIGLSLAGNATGDLVSGGLKIDGASVCSPYIAALIGLVTLAVAMVCSAYGKKSGKLIPFIYGILAGYALAVILTVIGNAAGVDELKVVSFESFSALFADGVKFTSFISLPDFTFIKFAELDAGITGSYIASLAVAYVPVAFVVFAEHIADHTNLSSIIEKNLLEDPGLDRTLLGDGVGSVAGALFGGCPNTTYGESIGCVAITKNASVYTILTAAVGAILVSFVSPFIALVNSIPSCVMGGVCMALYGFIAVSGLKMIKDINLNENKNLFVVSVVLISGVGGLSFSFANGTVTLTAVATALILGILTNLLLRRAPETESSEENR